MSHALTYRARCHLLVQINRLEFVAERSWEKIRVNEVKILFIAARRLRAQDD
jgi:hypothetical protein